MMVMNEDDVASWFQGLKGHQRIPFLRQLVNMCHPLELRFIASCVEDACRTDYQALRTSELHANSQTVLKSLTTPLDVEARNKIIIYLCLLNSTNKLCSRILNQKICDYDSVSQFCDEVHKHMRDGDLPTSQELRTLEELRLLYTLAYLHPSFDFSERQHFRSMCARLNELDKELKSLKRRAEERPADSTVPKPSCDAGSHRDSPSKTCSLCFSTSSSEHICKLRLLRRSPRTESQVRDRVRDAENQVNVRWSTGKYSNLAIRDSQLRQLHATLEGIISQPTLPAFPPDPDSSGHLNLYLQHLQGLSACTWPRSQSVFNFFKDIASDQDQRSKPAGSPRPHSVLTPRGGAGDPEPPHSLAMPVQNGATESADDSESSPPVLDDDTEVKSYTVYNSSIAGSRPGSRSPLPASLRTPAGVSSSSSGGSGGASPEPGPRPPLPGPPLSNGHLPAAGSEPRAAAVPPAPPPQGRSPDADRVLPMLAELGLRKHAAALASYTLAQLRALSGERLSELGLSEGAVRRLRVALDAAGGAAEPASDTSRPAAPSGGGQRRRTHRAVSRGRSGEHEPAAPLMVAARSRAEVAEEEKPRPPATKVGSAPPRPAAVAASAAANAANVPEKVAAPAGEPRAGVHRQAVTAAAVVMPTALAGGQTQTMPTYSSVAAQNITSVGQYGDGIRAGLLDNIVFTAQSSITPPPAPLICSPYRPPLPPSASAAKSAASSPSPPSASPAPPPPPPQYLPRAAFVATRPPPLPGHINAFVHYTTPGGGTVSGFLPGAFPAGAQDLSYLAHPFAAYTHYAPAPRPPPPPPPPPPRPPRFEACYNCGSDGHLGRYCSADPAAGDASLSQNQFKLFVASIREK